MTKEIKLLTIKINKRLENALVKLSQFFNLSKYKLIEEVDKNYINNL